MEITRESLQHQREAYARQELQLRSDADKAAGARMQCEFLLRQLDQPDPAPAEAAEDGTCGPDC